MTVATTNSRRIVDGNGVSQTFSTDFEFFDDDDLRVTYIERNDQKEIIDSTVLTLGSDYTVSGGADNSGPISDPTGRTGEVTLLDITPGENDQIVLERVEQSTQDLDLVENDPFPAQALENALDKLTYLVQQATTLAEDTVERTIRIPVGDPLGSLEDLPSSSERAGKFVTFTPTGAVALSSPEVEVTQRIFDTNTDVEAASIETGVTTIIVNRYSSSAEGGGGVYFNVPDEPDHAGKLQSADGAWWELSATVADVRMFGAIHNDRSAAAANAEAIQDALEFCGAKNVPALDLGPGVLFCSGPIVQDVPCEIRGHGVKYWAKNNTADTQQAALTQIVFTGTGSKDQTLFGVSSCRSWGADRVNPSPAEGYNDAVYRMQSFVTENASASDRSLAPFSAAWTITPGAQGTHFRGFRIIDDHGGPEGMDGYQTGDRTVTAPLPDGDWDIGVYITGTRTITMTGFQAVGMWRRGGLLIAPHRKDWPAAAYQHVYVDCVFNRVLVRSVDRAPVVGTTSDSIDIPWADDHPFGADGDLDLILGTGGRAGDKFTFTGMTKVTSGDYDILRLTGVSPDPTSKNYTLAMPDYRGGGTSHMIFSRCELYGFNHGSLVPSEKDDLGGVGPFDHPLANVEVSGNELTEISFLDCSLTGYESVMVHAHDVRHMKFDCFIEPNNGARMIMSPRKDENPHTSGDFEPVAETLDVVWEPRGSTLDNGVVDMRPYIIANSTPRFNSAGDNGFFTPAQFRAPRWAHSSMMDVGSMVLAPPGGKAGLGRWNAGQPNFFFPSFFDYFDPAFYYDEDLDEIIWSKRCKRANFDRQRGVTIIISDNEVGEYTPPCKGGLLTVVCNPDGSPRIEASGSAWFNIKAPGVRAGGASGVNFDVLDSTLTGTTGTDGRVTVGRKDGAIQIENRTGAELPFFLSVTA